MPRLPFLKPKPTTGSAFCPVVSKSVSYGSGKRASICSQEVCRTMTEFKHTLNDSIAAQMLIESTKKGRPHSPVPDDKGQDFTSAEIPHEIRSLRPQNNTIRAFSPNKLVVFPPEIPSQYRYYSKSPTPEPKKKTVTEIEPPTFTSTFKPNPQTENAVSQCPYEYSEFAELKYLPKFHGIKGPITTAMEVAPERPFTPVAVTEPIMKPSPWISLPIENENRPESPLMAALKTAPERAYSPIPTFTYASELEPKPIQYPVSTVKKTEFTTEAPALAQNFNFKTSEEPENSTRPVGNNPVRYMHGYNNRILTVSSQNIVYSKPVSKVNSQPGQLNGTSMKSSSSSFFFDQSLISGPHEPVESKSNYNEPFITRVPDFKESHAKHMFKTMDETLQLNHFQNHNNILKSQQQFSISNSSPTVNRCIAPGIQNKVTSYTLSASMSDKSLLKQTLNDQCKEDSNLNKNSAASVDGPFKYKSDNPNAVKLLKAVPFFAKTTSLPSSP